MREHTFMHGWMDGWMDGWMRTSVRGREPFLRYIHWPLLPPPSHYSRALGRVIPTTNQSTVANTQHGCSMGTFLSEKRHWEQVLVPATVYSILATVY